MAFLANRRHGQSASVLSLQSKESNPGSTGEFSGTFQLVLVVPLTILWSQVLMSPRMRIPSVSMICSLLQEKTLIQNSSPRTQDPEIQEREASGRIRETLACRQNLHVARTTRQDYSLDLHCSGMWNGSSYMLEKVAGVACLRREHHRSLTILTLYILTCIQYCLVLEDNFTELNPETWSREIGVGGFG